jgi:hypothetical protein
VANQWRYTGALTFLGEADMSRGGAGNGISYYASIKISGTLDDKDLEDIKQKINAILSSKINGKTVNGSIVKEARATDAKATVTLNVTY